MRYVIWHTPRTGSNVLCDCIVQTGLGGMRALNDAGLFIGFGEGVIKAYDEGAVEAYFERNRTDNGVEGCKLGWDYVEHLNKWLPFGAADKILASFDKHIIVSRHDKLAQAVSRLIAWQTGQWTSLDKFTGIEPVYNRERIEYFIAQSAGYEATIRTWLSLVGIRPLSLSYEDNCKNWTRTTEDVLEFLEIPQNGHLHIKPVLERQSNPLKREWVDRYLAGE